MLDQRPGKLQRSQFGQERKTAELGHFRMGPEGGQFRSCLTGGFQHDCVFSDEAPAITFVQPGDGKPGSDLD